MANANYLEIDSTVKNYFKSLEKIKPLSKEEERGLLIDYKVNHNINARNMLIEHNLRYANRLASSFRNKGVSYSDLISEANSGLIEAIENYDLKQDVKIISYAKWWMMQKMESAINKRNRMPETDIPAENEQPLLDDETEEIREQNEYERDNPFIVEDEDKNEEINREKFLREIMGVLSEREYNMVSMYYGVNGEKETTLDKIGLKYNLTKERVRQIIENAFKKIRSKSMLIENKYLMR